MPSLLARVSKNDKAREDGKERLLRIKWETKVKRRSEMNDKERENIKRNKPERGNLLYMRIRVKEGDATRQNEGQRRKRRNRKRYECTTNKRQPL